MKLNKVQDLFHALEVVLSAEDKEKLAQISQAYFATVDENFTLREKNYKLNQLLIEKDIRELYGCHACSFSLMAFHLLQPSLK